MHSHTCKPLYLSQLSSCLVLSPDMSWEEAPLRRGLPLPPCFLPVTDTVSPCGKVLWSGPSLIVKMESPFREEGCWECGQQCSGLWKNFRGLDQGSETFSLKGLIVSILSCRHSGLLSQHRGSHIQYANEWSRLASTQALFAKHSQPGLAHMP